MIQVVLVPQRFGLHWLLASNYLQHTHADGYSRIDFARNLKGLIKPQLFNVGLHTVHHLHGREHWSELPDLHLGYRMRIHARLRARHYTLHVGKHCMSENLISQPPVASIRQPLFADGRYGFRFHSRCG